MTLNEQELARLRARLELWEGDGCSVIPLTADELRALLDAAEPSRAMRAARALLTRAEPLVRTVAEAVSRFGI